jgi:uncharacterized damage-inducible protein DinB
VEIDRIETFLPYFEKVRERTLRVAERIPQERLEWSYREGAFSFGDLLRHLAAIERYMFAENARREPSRYPGHGRELADGYDAVFALLRRLHAETIEILSGLSPTDLKLRCRTPGGAEIPVWKWLRSMVEHEIHHRGQIYIYLGVLGISGPPLYGLTSEEVRERSVAMT